MDNERVGLSCIRIHTLDNRDESVWVQSSADRTYRMPRGHKDDFSFTDTDIIVISNRAEEPCTLRLQGVGIKDSGLFIGSNRRAGFYLRDGEHNRRALRMAPGEVLTVRNINMREKQTGVKVRPGQAVII